MTATTHSTALVTIQPAFTDAERLALARFLAGYRGLTREAYTLDLRQFTAWCRARSMPLFSVRRADIETLARELEAKGRARATVTRRLCTIAGFYKYSVEEELLEHSPAAHVRRPSGHCPGGQKPPSSRTGPVPPRSARLPALLRTGSPAQSIPARSPALLADASVVQPGGIAGHLARAAGEVIASLVS